MANLYVITAPSGAGKTSLIREVLARDAEVQLSVSHTTRAPRPGEIEGKDYYFISREQFLSMREKNEFLESAEVYGNFYGTSQQAIYKLVRKGKDVILEIDWQGARQIHKVFNHAIGIFILPPSIEALSERLRARATDSAEIIAGRIAAAREDLSHVSEFKYVIINHQLSAAVSDVLAILRAERLTLSEQKKRWPDLIA